MLALVPTADVETVVLQDGRVLTGADDGVVKVRRLKGVRDFD